VSTDGFLKRGAVDLRQAFDASFAVAPQVDVSPLIDLLEVRVADSPYLLRRADVGGLFRDKTITPLPGRVPDLLGLAAFRGTVVPVYDLGMLLGYAPASATRWLVSVAGGSVGFAFDGFESYLGARPLSIVPIADAHARRHVQEAVETPAGFRPIVHVASLVDTLRERARSGARFQEQE
jgi:chemotaxis signal transduction protein